MNKKYVISLFLLEKYYYDELNKLIYFIMCENNIEKHKNYLINEYNKYVKLANSNLDEIKETTGKEYKNMKGWRKK